MKAKIIIGALILSLCFPPASQAFGLLRYLFDAIANQLGLDRGPIPKTLPKPPTPPPGHAGPGHPDIGRIHIQADGF